MIGSGLTVETEGRNQLNPILRRHLGLPASNKSPRRVLFGGPPDPKECAALAQTISERSQIAFSKKWNFNITSKEEVPRTLQPQAREKVEVFEWKEAFSSDYMSRCDRTRYEAPLAPMKRRLPTLFYAPTIPPSEVENAPVPESLVMASAEASKNKREESQTDQAVQVDLPKKRKSDLTLSFFTMPVAVTSKSEVKAKKSRPFPVPLTIPPASPDTLKQEVIDDEVEEEDDMFSPVPGVQQGPAAAFSPEPEDNLKGPIKRRHSLGAVFTFESPSAGMRCLRIRNGSPSVPHPTTKIMRQRVITDYVQVKKPVCNKT